MCRANDFTTRPPPPHLLLLLLMILVVDLSCLSHAVSALVARWFFLLLLSCTRHLAEVTSHLQIFTKATRERSTRRLNSTILEIRSSFYEVVHHTKRAATSHKPCTVPKRDHSYLFANNWLAGGILSYYASWLGLDYRLPHLCRAGVGVGRPDLVKALAVRIVLRICHEVCRRATRLGKSMARGIVGPTQETLHASSTIHGTSTQSLPSNFDRPPPHPTRIPQLSSLQIG